MTRVVKTTFAGYGRLYRVLSGYRGEHFHTIETDCFGKGHSNTQKVSLDTAKQFGMKPCPRCRPMEN